MSENTFSGQNTGTDGKPLVGDVPAPVHGSEVDPGPGDTWSNLGTYGAGARPGSTASDFDSAAADLVGPLIETVDLSLRYDVQERVGSGGMGQVYRGHDRKLNRPVAIKRLKAELARDAKQLQRFVDEARTVATLSHAHIVHVYDYGKDAQGPFLILEFLEGESLAERLQRGPLELQEALQLLIPICEAVTFAHSRHVIHRDIKPANIFVSTNGIAKLGDFGIARQQEVSTHTSAGAVLGTFDYMSPEQMADSTQVDGRSDLWSLACTLYEALTCRSPRHLELDAVPVDVREIIAHAHRVNPDERYASVEEFTVALRAVGQPNRQTSRMDDLKEGECPECHTLNRPDRKYCKEPSCKTKMWEACPKCRTESPVWELVCAGCGADLPSSWAERERDVDVKSQLIESLVGEYRFGEAQTLLHEIAALEGTRWKQWREWAESYGESLDSDKQAQDELTAQLLESAHEAFRLADYKEVVGLLVQIPEPVRTPEIRELIEKAEARRKEIKTLLQELEQLVRSKQFDLLRPRINRVLELSPGDPRITQLDQQLREREARKLREQAEIQRREKLPKSSSIFPSPFSDGDSGEIVLEDVPPSRPLRPARPQPSILTKLWRSLPDAKRQLQIVAVVFITLMFLFGVVLMTISNSNLLNPRQTGTGSIESGGSKPGDLQTLKLSGIDVPFHWCPAGKFKMGSPADEKGRWNDETQVDVELTRGFWMEQTEVTQDLYEAVMQTNPSRFRGARRPVETVTWDDAQLFCEKLTKQWRDAKVLPPGWRVSLPTEAQWEYACRAGTTSAYSHGDSEGDLSAYGWYDANSDRTTHDVAQKRANPWGLFDMHGNVWERCADRYDEKLMGGRDPSRPSGGSNRVFRGGSWDTVGANCRSALRNWYDGSSAFIYIGFRVCLSADGAM